MQSTQLDLIQLAINSTRGLRVELVGYCQPWTVLRQAWSQVLGVDASHIRDDSSFARLGGSSINAIKLVAALRKKSVDVTTSQVLAHPVLRDQVRIVQSNQAKGTEPRRVRSRTPEPFELL